MENLAKFWEQLFTKVSTNDYFRLPLPSNLTEIQSTTADHAPWSNSSIQNLILYNHALHIFDSDICHFNYFRLILIDLPNVYLGIYKTIRHRSYDISWCHFFTVVDCIEASIQRFSRVCLLSNVKENNENWIFLLQNCKPPYEFQRTFSFIEHIRVSVFDRNKNIINL